MAARKSLFNKPKWAADATVDVNADTMFRGNKLEEFEAAQLKREEERQARKQKRREEAQRKNSNVDKSKIEGNAPSVKRRRISSDSVIAEDDTRTSREKTTVQEKKTRHVRKSEPVSSPLPSDVEMSSPAPTRQENEHTATPKPASEGGDEVAIIDVQPRKGTSTASTQDEQSDEETDPYFRELNRKLRAERRLKAQANGEAAESEPIITVRVTTLIPNCNPMNFDLKPSQTLGIVLADYVKKQEIPERWRSGLWLLWDGEKQYDSTTVRTLMALEERRSTSSYALQRRPVSKVEVEVVNEDAYQHRRRQKLREQQRLETGVSPPPPDAQTTEEPVQDENLKGIVIELKTSPGSSWPEMRLRVRQDTTIQKIVRGYKRKTGIDSETALCLSFDGEVLEGTRTVADIGFEEGDSVEVLARA